MIQWPYPIPHPGPPLPVPVPQPGPGPAPGFTDPVIGDVGGVGSVGVDSTTVVGAVGATPSVPASGGGATAGPVQVGDWKQFLIWIAALAALWLILTAAQDAGYPEFANGMAGLIFFGAILALGPKAVTNAKLIFQ